MLDHETYARERARRQGRIQAVLMALDSICLEKADWVESPESIGTPDRVAGKAWRSVAKAIGRVVDGAASLVA